MHDLVKAVAAGLSPLAIATAVQLYNAVTGRYLLPGLTKLAKPAPIEPFRFLDLPRELRDQILELAVTDTKRVVVRTKGIRHSFRMCCEYRDSSCYGFPSRFASQLL